MRRAAKALTLFGRFWFVQGSKGRRSGCGGRGSRPAVRAVMSILTLLWAQVYIERRRSVRTVSYIF